jgi:hypothetical protein
LVSVGPGMPRLVMSLEQTYKVPPFSSASTPSIERLAAPCGRDELLRLSAGCHFHHPPKIEASDIERSVAGRAQAFRKTVVGNADRRGLRARHDVTCDAEYNCQDDGVPDARVTALDRSWGRGRRIVHDGSFRSPTIWTSVAGFNKGMIAVAKSHPRRPYASRLPLQGS